MRADSWIPPYNLACLRAIDGEPDEALALLGTAVERGLPSQDLLDENDDFQTVRTSQAGRRWSRARDRGRDCGQGRGLGCRERWLVVPPRRREAEVNRLSG